MPRTSPSLFVLGLAAAISAHLPAAPAEPAARVSAIEAALGADARLQKRVTVRKRDLPLSELLGELAAQLGVRLTCTRDTADEKVTLFSEQRPAAETLSILAHQFDFRWTSSGGGYELGQDVASKQREAQRISAEIAQRIATIDSRVQRYQRLRNTPTDELARHWTELGSKQAETMKPEERREIDEERGAINDLLHHSGHVAVDLYLGLTPEQMKALRAGVTLHLSSENGTLAPQMAARIESAINEGLRPIPPDPDFPQVAARAMIQLVPGDGGSFGLEAAGHLPQLSITLISIRQKGLERRLLPDLWEPSNLSASVAPDRPLSTADPDLKRTLTLNFGPEAARAAQAVPLPILGALSLLQLPEGWMPLSRFAEVLHRDTGLRVVADSYIRERLNPSHYLPIQGYQRSIFEYIQNAADDLRVDWEKDGDLIRFRSRSYFDDRLTEVPPRLLNPWRDTVLRTGGPTLDQLAELAVTLTDEQARGMQAYWTWYLAHPDVEQLQSPGGFYDNREHLRFWATLSEAQRKSLLGGGELPVSRLTASQRDAFTRAFLSRSDGVRAVDAQPEPVVSPSKLASASFSLLLSAGESQRLVGLSPDGTLGGFLKNAVTTDPVVPGKGLPSVAPLPPASLKGPDGAPIDLQPLGIKKVIADYSFLYHLPGETLPTKWAQLTLHLASGSSAAKSFLPAAK